MNYKPPTSIRFFSGLKKSFKNDLTEQIDRLRIRHNEKILDLRLKNLLKAMEAIKLPITLIDGSIQAMALTSSNGSEEAPLQELQKNIDTLKDHVDQLTFFNADSVDKRSPVLRSIPLTSTLEQIVFRFKFWAESKCICLVFSSRLNDDRYWVDQEKLEAIIFELLYHVFLNTRKRGKVKIKLDLKNDLDDGQPSHWEIEIKHTCTNKSHSIFGKLKALFFPYRQRKKKDKFEVAALNKVQTALALLQGYFGGKSELEGQTSYTLGFPIEKKYLRQPVKQRVEWREASFNHQSPCMGSLLLVEPDRALSNLFYRYLSSWHQVDASFDGDSALKRVEEQLPDLILVGGVLPQMSGAAFCQKLKEQPATAHIPLILLSEPNPTMSEAPFNMADYYFSHPIEISVLGAKIKRILSTLDCQKNFFRKSVLLEPCERNNRSLSHQFFKKLSDYLRDHITDPELNVTKASQDLRISRVHFYRKVKEISGKSPVEFIRDFKLTVAAQLLEQHSYNINEVCFKSGFQDVSYFRKCFKKKYGVCSSIYKRKKKELIINATVL